MSRTCAEVGGSLPMTKSILNWDIKHSLWMHNAGSKVPRWCLRALEYFGDGLLWLPVASAACLAPKFAGQPFFYNLLIGLYLDILIVGLIKALVRRPRPVYNKGMYLVVSVDHYSFPSGHSSRAFLVLTITLAQSSLWKSTLPSTEETLAYYLVTSVAVLWAVATSSGRVLLGRHYVLDVVIGSVLGVVEAWFALKVLLSSPLLSEDNQHWLHQLRDYLKEAIMSLM